MTFKRVAQVKRPLVPGKAKNVVFFLGDGMGVSTLTTARVHKGQQRAGMVGGEQEKLIFEQFPHLGQLPFTTYLFSYSFLAHILFELLCGSFYVLLRVMILDNQISQYILSLCRQCYVAMIGGPVEYLVHLLF